MVFGIIPGLANELSACTRETWLFRGTWAFAIPLNISEIPKSILIWNVPWDMGSCQFDNWMGGADVYFNKTKSLLDKSIFSHYERRIALWDTLQKQAITHSFLIHASSWCSALSYVPGTVPTQWGKIELLPQLPIWVLSAGSLQLVGLHNTLIIWYWYSKVVATIKRKIHGESSGRKTFFYISSSLLYGGYL